MLENKVSILFIIVTYNAMKWIDRCIGSIENVSIEHGIFIVDNGSIDGTRKYILTHYKNVIFRQSKKNLGFGKANNLGFKYAIENKYDYVYLLNQDAWLLPNSIEKLLLVQQRNSEYGILSPFQIQANMHNLDNNFAIGVCSFRANKNLISDLYFGDLEEVYEVSGVMAAHWLISRECLLKVGGFSPSFPHYGEDDNYSERARYFKFKIGVVPSVMAVHDRGLRKETLEHKIYMECYIAMIRLINSPCRRNIFKTISRWMFCNFYFTFRYLKFSPIKYTFKLLGSLVPMIHNYKISIKTSRAFL